MKITALAPKTTARQNLVTVLAQEILAGTYDPKFPIPSEHQLCRRFGVSRVTVRLALSDLQNRGLIYRHHGKGTFIHANSLLGGKPLAVFMRTPAYSSCPSVSALLNGFQSYLGSAESYSVSIGTSPEQWSPALAASLGGVLVVPDGVTVADLENLKKRNLPYLIVGASDLPGPSLRLGTESSVYEAVLTLASRGAKRFGFLHGTDSPYDGLKLQGAVKALAEAGLPSTALDEVACQSACSSIRAAAERMLDRTPPPEVVLTSEVAHTLALLGAARERNLTVGKDLQIITFGVHGQDNAPDLSLNVIDLPFFEGGKKAAKALCQASLLSLPLESISLLHHINWAA